MTFNPQHVRHRNVLKFFNGSSSHDEAERSRALNQIVEMVKLLARECYLPVGGSTAGTVGRSRLSNDSSPTRSIPETPTSSHRSSISEDGTFSTDGSASGSASASSYAASPVAGEGNTSISGVTNVQRSPTISQQIGVSDETPIEYDTSLRSDSLIRLR